MAEVIAFAPIGRVENAFDASAPPGEIRHGGRPRLLAVPGVGGVRMEDTFLVNEKEAALTTSHDS